MQRLSDQFASADIPQSYSGIVTARGQELTIRVERHRLNRALIIWRARGQEGDGGSAGGVQGPQAHFAVLTARGQELTIRVEHHRSDRALIIWRARGSRKVMEGALGVSKVHRRTLPSRLPTARRFPSGWNATAWTGL